MLVMNRKPALAVVGAAMVAVLAAGCTRPAAGQRVSQGPPPVPVRAAQAEQKRVPIAIEVIGRAEPLETVSVRSQVTGKLLRVHFHEGDDVRQGSLLFTIDPRPFQVALDQAKANHARSRAQAHNARVQADRYAELVKHDLVSREQYDNTVAAAAALEAGLEADAVAIESARLNLEYCSIRAPITGRTGNLIVTEGNLVKANDTPALVVINQIAPIAVSFAVPEASLTVVRQALVRGPLAVAARAPGAATAAVGRVTFLSNAVDPSTGTILLKGTFANTDRQLWPGQFVNVSLVLGELPAAVVVPAAAVQTGQQGQYVFVISPDGRAELRKVVTGQTLRGEAVIDRGVGAGERVVTDGHLRLVPGARVQLSGS